MKDVYCRCTKDSVRHRDTWQWNDVKYSVSEKCKHLKE